MIGLFLRRSVARIAFACGVVLAGPVSFVGAMVSRLRDARQSWLVRRFVNQAVRNAKAVSRG